MNKKPTVVLFVLYIAATLFATIGTSTNHWATTSEDEGISCDIEIRGHAGLYWVYDTWRIDCPGGSQNDKQRNKLSCDILKEGSDKCGTLRVAKYAAVISSVAAGVSGIPVALLWHRQNSYSSNKEMIVLVTLIFFTVAIAAVFALVAAEMFRQFISDASEYSIDSPLSPGGEYIIETTWTFSFSWILMISSATIEILMIILTLFIYYDRAQVQSELDAQVFL